jgi:hypothetical protein
MRPGGCWVRSRGASGDAYSWEQQSCPVSSPGLRAELRRLKSPTRLHNIR